MDSGLPSDSVRGFDRPRVRGDVRSRQRGSSVQRNLVRLDPRFGPGMTVRARVAFGGAGLTRSIGASIVLGFLAAAISFARYFPNREEDRAKGKRTPVTILGERRATKVFDGLFLAPFSIGVALLFLRGGIVWMIVLVLVAAPVLLAFHLGAKLPRLYEFAIALTIASHLFVGFGLILDFAFGL